MASVDDSREADAVAVAHSAAVRAARESYGQLLALIASSTHDLAAAEDALADAFERALRVWQEEGIPSNPEGWLLTVARNRLRDLFRSSERRSTGPLNEGVDPPSPLDVPAILERSDEIPDKRLELLFVCAHPAIDPSIRTPLMLQVVLGIDAARIARAFDVEPAAMAQRLVRAKKRIAATGIPFVVPQRAQLAERLPAVLEAIYGAYAIDWLSQGENVRESVADEARWLAVLLASLLQDDPEGWGLAALLTLAQSRAPARVGDPWPALDEQDTALWDAELIAEGEALLRRASRLGEPLGRFQLEAAIQSVHCDRARTSVLDIATLETLYRGLAAIAPTRGALDAQAAVRSRMAEPEQL